MVSVLQQHAACQLLHLIRPQYGNRGLQLLFRHLVVLHIFLDAVLHGAVEELHPSVQELVHRAVEQGRQLGQLGDVRHAIAPLPIGHGLEAYIHFVCKLCLRHIP